MSGLNRVLVIPVAFRVIVWTSIGPGASCRRTAGAVSTRSRQKRKALSLVAALLLSAGCTAPSPPELTMQPGASLSASTLLAVAPASNDTGQTYELDITGVFTDDLRSALRSKGYTVADSNTAPPNAVIVQCSFISYAPGNAAQRWIFPGLGPTEATVKTSLIDENTGNVLGGMLTRKEVTGGGLLSVGAYKFILQHVANDVADAIDKKIKGI
jgi:Domain of unknown function (DUF4410)